MIRCTEKQCLIHASFLSCGCDGNCEVLYVEELSAFPNNVVIFMSCREGSLKFAKIFGTPKRGTSQYHRTMSKETLLLFLGADVSDNYGVGRSCSLEWQLESFTNESTLRIEYLRATSHKYRLLVAQVEKLISLIFCS